MVLSDVLSLGVFPVVLTELRGGALTLEVTFTIPVVEALVLGADGDGGRAEDRLGSLWRLDDGELLVLVGFLEGIVF